MFENDRGSFKLVKTKEETISIVNNIIKELRKEYAIKHVYLFGSVIRENFNNSSDIDIGVIVDGEVTFEDKLRIFSKVRRINPIVEVFVCSKKDFDIVSSDIVAEIKQNGIRII
jgi:predicted nucleotidyltransferase